MNKQEKLNQLENKLILDINNKSYYEDFDHEIYGNTLEPGSMPAPYFYDWVANETSNRLNNQPVLGIEVGSFLGYSAIGFAKKLKETAPGSKLICIDTWLGSPEHYRFLKRDGDNRLGWKNGYPTMYHKFISNVIYNDLQDVIIPLAFPSTIAFKVLKSLFDEIDIKADFAYIDGSHEEHEVYMDLYYYYQLLSTDSYLCGDDWAWESVRNDVTKFGREHDLKVNVHQNQVHWNIIK
jgi:hypothetical protein